MFLTFADETAANYNKPAFWVDMVLTSLVEPILLMVMVAVLGWFGIKDKKRESKAKAGDGEDKVAERDDNTPGLDRTAEDTSEFSTVDGTTLEGSQKGLESATPGFVDVDNWEWRDLRRLCALMLWQGHPLIMPILEG